MCAGVPVPSEEGGAEVPGPEGARGGEAGQVTRPGPLPRQAGGSDSTPVIESAFQNNSVQSVMSARSTVMHVDKQRVHNFQGTHSKHLSIMTVRVRNRGSRGPLCWAFVGGSWSLIVPPAGREKMGGIHRGG